MNLNWKVRSENCFFLKPKHDFFALHCSYYFSLDVCLLETKRGGMLFCTGAQMSFSKYANFVIKIAICQQILDLKSIVAFYLTLLIVYCYSF